MKSKLNGPEAEGFTRNATPVAPPRRRPRGAAPAPCQECRRPTDEPRRGLCPRCYQDAYQGRSKARACECCAHADPRTLVRRSVTGDMRTLCANCAAILGRRRLSLRDLKLEVRPPGDRRAADRRRADRRTPAERRARIEVGALLADKRVKGRRAVDGRAPR